MRFAHLPERGSTGYIAVTRGQLGWSRRNPTDGPGGMPSRFRKCDPRLWKWVYTGLRTERAVMSLVRRHPVVTFFLLAIVLSWAGVPWGSFFAPAVLVAALIVVS